MQHCEPPLLLCFQPCGTRRSAWCRARLNSKCCRCNCPAHRLDCWLTRILDGTSRQLKHRALLPVAQTWLVLEGHMYLYAGWSLRIQVVYTDDRNDLSEGGKQTKSCRIFFQFHPLPRTESKHRELISIKTMNALLLSICDSFPQCQVSTYYAIMCRSPC